MMNGYDDKAFEDDFGGRAGGVMRAFDAFPKSKPQYVTQTAGGGKWTVLMVFISLVLIQSELARWWRGAEAHTFAVERGVGHAMLMNFDTVVRMRCADLHINVQDSAGDRILAAARLARDPTNWAQWVDREGVHRLGRDAQGRVVTGAGFSVVGGTEEEGFGEEHVHDIIAIGRKRSKFAKTPKLRGDGDSCRIYGQLELNKVQGDFHITARGHGYHETSAHLEHSAFNFSHIISELSFGPFYPSLVNPLDHTINVASAHFHKFQYYLSIVPTEYKAGRAFLATNQYAVTEQSREVPENYVPGIFVKYDIEPMLLVVEETRSGLLVFLFKVVNVLSGVLVAGHWGFTLSEWVVEMWGKRKRAGGFIGEKDG